LTGAKNLAATGIRSPDRPARSESLYRLNYPGPQRKSKHILYAATFFENHVFFDNVAKFCRVGQAKDKNMAQAHFTLST
jgi:hypothetical protein